MNDNINVPQVQQPKVGRPTVMGSNTVAKLVAAFKVGATDEQACDYAQIDGATYYRHLNSDEDFAREIRSAKIWPRVVAGSVVMTAITKNKSLSAAQWWLEKKHANEFTQAGTINSQGGPIQVIIKDYARPTESGDNTPTQAKGSVLQEP